MEGQPTSLPSLGITIGEPPKDARRRSALQLANRPVVLAAVTVVALAALVAFVGADARWLAALGNSVAGHRAIPTGVPFAAASTNHWPNVIVLAELIFYGLESVLGDRGLMLAQILAVGFASAMLGRDAFRGGASPQGTAVALLLASVGGLASLSVARAQLFSIALFPVLIALLRAEARDPSRRIWLAIPLLALWSNLHGAVLVGLGVMVVYLAVSRFSRDPRTAIAVTVAAPIALCLTPAGLRTIDYYLGVLSNQAAARGQGLWAPLSLSHPLDVVLVGAAIALAVRFSRSRPPAWELLASILLAAMTVQASRSGVWLLFFLMPSAARVFTSRRAWDHLLPVLGTLGLVALVFAIVRGPLPTGGSPAAVARAIALAHGTPVLAEAVQAEQVALAGGRIWVGNPIDAFSKRDQNTYLDWVEGRPSGHRALVSQVLVVLTGSRSPARRLMDETPDFVRVDAAPNAVIFLRRP